MAPNQTVTFYMHRQGIDTNRQLITTIERDRLVAHSLKAREYLASQPKPANATNVDITLSAGAPAAYRRVLGTIKAFDGKEKFQVNARDLNTMGKLAVWHACKELRLQPEDAQHRLFGTITWAITHDKLTPEVMQMVWDVLSPLRDDPADDFRYKRALTAMAHQYVWDMLHGRFTDDERKALEAIYAPLPGLGNMIGDKQDELEPKKQVHDMWKSKDEARAAGRKVVREKKERDETRKMERIARQVDEVIAGTRVVTDELWPYVQARQQQKQ